MDRSKLKDIIRTLEITLDTLKAEVYSDVDSYKSEEEYSSRPLDYDELYDDEDDLLTYDEMQEVSMESADSSSFSVKQKLMQGSVIDTDAFMDETSSDSD